MPMRHWDALTVPEISAAEEDAIAILPLGATEQHGPHLPTGTDRMIVDAVIVRAAARFSDGPEIMILPTLPVGLSPEHQRFPGTLTATAETLLRLWTEIGASVARAGFRKIVLVNAHGGQSALAGLVAQNLRSTHKMIAVPFHAYRPWRQSEMFDAAEHHHGIHGGAIETSVMLALDPNLVRRNRAERFTSSSAAIARDHPALAPDGRLAFAWEAQDLHPSGAIGDATDADAQRGAALLDIAADALVKLIRDLDALPLGTIGVD